VADGLALLDRVQQAEHVVVLDGVQQANGHSHADDPWPERVDARCGRRAGSQALHQQQRGRHVTRDEHVVEHGQPPQVLGMGQERLGPERRRRNALEVLHVQARGPRQAQHGQQAKGAGCGEGSHQCERGRGGQGIDPG